MNLDEYRAYELWREVTLLDPDVSLEAYIHHVAAEAALTEKRKEA